MKETVNVTWGTNINSGRLGKGGQEPRIGQALDISPPRGQVIPAVAYPRPSPCQG